MQSGYKTMYMIIVVIGISVVEEAPCGVCIHTVYHLEIKKI